MGNRRNNPLKRKPPKIIKIESHDDALLNCEKHADNEQEHNEEDVDEHIPFGDDNLKMPLSAKWTADFFQDQKGLIVKGRGNP